MKRHERPYCCTISGCGKAFGSKHDWKRHEMSQHMSTLTTPVYRCNAHIHLGLGEIACAKICMSFEAAFEHQWWFHSIHDPGEASSKVHSGVCGMTNLGSTFWCGFCEVIVPCAVTMSGDTLAERFDHIDHHFMTERKKIAEWVPMKQGLLPTNSPNCIRCQEVFETQGLLSRHQIEIDCVIRCSDCAQEFESKAQRYAHWEAKHCRV
jgi:hypothetical protein